MDSPHRYASRYHRTQTPTRGYLRTVHQRPAADLRELLVTARLARFRYHVALRLLREALDGHATASRGEDFGCF